jgi:ABC-2 type transport system permease protein
VSAADGTARPPRAPLAGTAPGPSTGTAPGPTTGTAPGRAVTRLALGQLRRGALIVTGLAAGMSGLVAATYRSTVGDGLDAAALAALAENPAIRTLFGPPVALETAGGFTVWRTGTVLTVLVASWALLTATRLTRAEEETGRWDLLLAGLLPMTTVLRHHLAVLVAALVTVGVAVTLALLVAGTPVAGAVLHGAGIALLGTFFAALGALAAQLLTTRGAANGATVAVLGAGLLARMVGDGIERVGWLRWLSPFGLTALSRPYAADRVAPLLVLVVATAVLLVAAPAVAARRDVRGGWLPAPSGRRPRLRLLHSVPAFAVRRLRRPLLGWMAGLGAYYLLIGLLAVSMTDFLADNPQLAARAERAGFGGLGSVDGYAGAMFALLAVPVGLFAAARIAATADDESRGRLTLLHAQPLSRLRTLGAEAAVTAGGAVLLCVVAAAATWAGAVAVDAPLGPLDSLAGTLNVLPVAALCLGAALFALGWLPRAVLAVGALPAAGGFLLHVLAGSTDLPGWLGRLSPFTHLAAVPGEPANHPAAVVMLLVAAVLGGAGAAGYRRRDLRG